MPKNKPPIPKEFKTLDEIQDFWGKHSTADYWDEMEDVELELSPSLKSKLELKKLYRLLDLSEKQIAKIEVKAKTEKMEIKQLLSKWISQHVLKLRNE